MLLAHTGAIDSVWRLVKDQIPCSFSSTIKGHKHKPQLLLYARQWQWRLSKTCFKQLEKAYMLRHSDEEASSKKKMEQQKTRHMKKHKNLVKTIKNHDFWKGIINKSMDVWGVNGSSFCMALPARALHGHSLILEVFAMQHPQNQDELATYPLVI